MSETFNNFSGQKTFTSDEPEQPKGSILSMGRDELFSKNSPRHPIKEQAPKPAPPVAQMAPFGKVRGGIDEEEGDDSSGVVSFRSAHRQPEQPDKTDALDAQWSKWQKRPSTEATEAILTAVKPVIDQAITTYAGKSSPLLSSQARLLAVQAMRSYKPEKGANLRTWMMKQLQGLGRYRHQLSPIHVPERTAIDMAHVYRTTEELKSELGRDPSEDEVANASGFSPTRLRKLAGMQSVQTNESQLTDEEGAPYLPGVPSNSPENLWAELVYHDLDNRDRAIYDMLMGRNGHKAGTPITEIAKKLHVSSSAISQRAKRIADRLESGASIQGQI